MNVKSGQTRELFLEVRSSRFQYQAVTVLRRSGAIVDDATFVSSWLQGPPL
jgi:hypothetical protein